MLSKRARRRLWRTERKKEIKLAAENKLAAEFENAFLLKEDKHVVINPFSQYPYIYFGAVIRNDVSILDFRDVYLTGHTSVNYMSSKSSETHFAQVGGIFYRRNQRVFERVCWKETKLWYIYRCLPIYLPANLIQSYLCDFIMSFDTCTCKQFKVKYD